MANKHIDAILLAAGSSSRFGSDKRLHQIDGVPMLQHSIATLIDRVRFVLVVLRLSDKKSLPDLLGGFVQDQRIKTVFIEQPERGMGSNLAQAVRQLPDDCAAVLISLADMPFLKNETVKKVVAAYQPEKIIVPVRVDENSERHRGHPVLFTRCFFAELECLQGDRGARVILQAHAGAIEELVLDDDGILRDVDVLM
jgi:molybdenum cofactor cytidylyltransferase